MSTILKCSIAALAAVMISGCGGSSESSDSPSSAAEVPPATESTETPPTEPASAETPPTETTDTAQVETPTDETAPTTDAPAGSAEFASLPEPYKSADYARGKRVFRTCSSCHMLDPEAGNLVGPNLHGMFDRKAGALEGFDYSKALQEADFQWTAEELDNWLANPRTYLPGNNMSFTGVRREPDRVAVIAYLLAETAK